MPTGTLSPPLTAGRYYLQTAQQNVFCAYVAAQATSLVGTAMVGLQLYNPVGSGKNLVLIDIGGMIVVTSASLTSLVLAYGVSATAPTGQTAATQVSSTLLGIPSTSLGLPVQALTKASPAGLALSAGTFANAPVPIYNLLHNTAAIATTGEDTGFRIDLGGRFIVPPGNFVAIAAVGAAAAAAAMNADLSWIEPPI